MAKSKLEKGVKLAEEPQVEQEVTLESLAGRMDKLVVVVNNIITYCNTIERWRTMKFSPEKPAEANTGNLSKEAEQTEKS